MSCAPSSTRLSFTQGDTAKLQFSITKADCTTAEDLTLFTDITFTIKRSNQDSDAGAVFQGTLVANDIAIVGPITDGVIEVTIPPAFTKLLRIGRLYYWDVQIKADSENIFTPLFGTLLATSESTREG